VKLARRGVGGFIQEGSKVYVADDLFWGPSVKPLDPRARFVRELFRLRMGTCI
jgi:hypothetical protein